MDPELWRTHPALAIASLAPVLLGAAWMAFARGLPVLREHRALVTAATWIATRVAFAVIVWGVFGHMSLDSRTWFVPQARAVLAGGLPYRDFQSVHGPLFAPLLAPAVALFGDLGPGIVFLAADLVTWRALAAAEGEASDAAWAWVAMPIVWISVVRYAQDEPLAALFVALAWLASKRERPVAAGLALAAGFLCSKPLLPLPALALFAGMHGARARTRLVLAALIPVALVYADFAALGAPVLQPLTLEGGAFGTGPTLWRLPAVFGHIDPGLWGWLPFVALAAWGLARLGARGAGAPAHAAWQYGAFAALSPKFLPMYALLWTPLLGVWAGAEPRRKTWLVLEGTLLALAWPLESGPLQGLFGAIWRAIAILGIAAMGLLALWPIAEETAGARR